MYRVPRRLRALARQADGWPSANVGNKKGRGQRRAESRDVFLLPTSTGRASYCRVLFIMFYPPQRCPRGHFLWPSCCGVSQSIGTRRPFSAWRRLSSRLSGKNQPVSGRNHFDWLYSSVSRCTRRETGKETENLSVWCQWFHPSRWFRCIFWLVDSSQVPFATCYHPYSWLEVAI